MDQIKLPLEPHHLGVPSGASKMIYEPMVRLAQTVHLSWTDTSTISKRTETIFHKSNVTYEFYRVRQTDVRAYGTFDAKHATILHRRQRRFQTDQNEISHDPRHLGVPSSASTTVSNPMVCSGQTAHLSCVKISTISTRTEMGFQLSLVT